MPTNQYKPLPRQDLRADIDLPELVKKLNLVLDDWRAALNPQLQERSGLIGEPAHAFGAATYRSSGNVIGLNNDTARGVSSVSRTGVGLYTVGLSRPFTVLEQVQVQTQSSGAQTVAGVSVTGTSSTAVTVRFNDFAGSATDPADGDVLLIRVAAR